MLKLVVVYDMFIDNNACNAVFVLDTGFHVFVWVGKEASSHEKGGGLIIAHVSPVLL